MEYDQILTVSALVAAYVGVIKGLDIVPSKYLPLLAVLVAALFVLVPSEIQGKIVLISTIGLSATGVYALSKTPTYLNKKDDRKSSS